MKHNIGAKFPEVVSHKDLNHYSTCCMSSSHFYMCQSQKMRHSLSLLLSLLDMAGLCRKMSQG